MENNQNLNTLNVDTTPDVNAGFRKARKKQRILLVAAAICCIAIVATGTLAYFTAEEKAYNVITTGYLSMDLVEETTGGKPFPDKGISGVTPGMTVDKIAYVENNGGVDFWTRLSFTMKVTGENGQELSDKYISLDINTNAWTERDGFYYYNASVKPGEETEPIFTKVSFAKEMGNEYMNAKVEIDIDAYAVQSKNNGDSALTATGWTLGK